MQIVTNMAKDYSKMNKNIFQLYLRLKSTIILKQSPKIKKKRSVCIF
jgi:hypothetical protein